MTDSRKRGTYRAALAAVIILSVLLVLAVIAVAAGFVRQYRILQAHRAAAGADGAAALQLAPGAHVVSTATADGKLVLHVQTREGSEVDIIDLATGKLVSRIKDGAK